MHEFGAIVTAIIGLAIIAVLVKSSNTSGLITAATSGFSSILSSAEGGAATGVGTTPVSIGSI